MFSGIIKKTGTVNKIIYNKKDIQIGIKSRLKLSNKDLGSSINCSGVCLTLEKIYNGLYYFYLSRETLKISNFENIKLKHIVNLEKSLKFGNEISGHFVQGHVDTTSSIKKIENVGKSWLINFQLSKKYKKYVVEKGSITINGVSLTISKILKNGFQIAIIPKTLELTNLMNLKEKDLVNVEFDVLGKYIKSFIK